jgi:hypothetical protein
MWWAGHVAKTGTGKAIIKNKLNEKQVMANEGGQNGLDM